MDNLDLTTLVSKYAILVMPWSLIVLYAIGWTVRELFILRQLRRVGIKAFATVIRRKKEWGKRDSYSVTYQFCPDRQQPEVVMTRTQSVSESSYLWLTEDKKVRICYLPRNPKVSRLAGKYEDNHTLRAMVMFLPLLILIYVVLILMVLSYSQRSAV